MTEARQVRDFTKITMLPVIFAPGEDRKNGKKRDGSSRLISWLLAADGRDRDREKTPGSRPKQDRDLGQNGTRIPVGH